MATMTPYSTYQEFYEILLWVEDSENMLSDNEEEEEKDNIIKIKVSHLRDLARRKVLRGVVPVLVLLVGVRVPRRHGGAAVLKVPAFGDREISVVLVVHSTVDVIVDILESVDRAT